MFQEALRYLFNVLILFKTGFYLQISLKIKIDTKTCNFKNMQEILKTWRKFAKNIWQPWLCNLLEKE